VRLLDKRAILVTILKLKVSAYIQLIIALWGCGMKVYRAINNNIVSAFDADGVETILIGRGIGYSAKEGDEIDPCSIQKTFKMSSKREADHLEKLFQSIPNEHLEVTDDIFSYAKKKLNKQLNERAFISLADHISFAIQRFKQNVNLQNPLLSEVRRLYVDEYEIGLWALDLLWERFGIRFPNDEAASIAIHIFNAEYDISISDVFRVTQLLTAILQRISTEMNWKLNEDDYHCQRFIAHTKFLCQRVVKKQELTKKDEALGDFIASVSQHYPRELACARNIAAFLADEHGYNMSLEEISSMTIHIKRLNS
jgi:beta-glucoside operon transcriptional antiterminator